MKTIISAALTGAWPSKKDNPALPITPQEIARDVFECYEAGASIVHLHMRDDSGQGTMDVRKFRETVELIRARKDVDVLLNLTTSGDLAATDETRQLHLRELRPELASYDCGSMNWMHQSLFLNPPQFLEQLGKTMQEYNVKPEIEIFDAGMVYNALYYLKQGILKAPLHFQFVLGAAGGMGASVDNLVFLKNLIPEGSSWSALGIGKAHLPIMLATLALGGHVRVGMEDNVMFAAGQLAESNAQLVRRAAELIRIAGNEPATPEDARKILSITR
ncbi:MAG: 3-keto-5-aminohexanoate cleavage protein [Spirochaetaceae bacterium]|nr:3-keto-5-aminohexanoate cleavage protein [Spirochaetaceae bacterium]